MNLTKITNEEYESIAEKKEKTIFHSLDKNVSALLKLYEIWLMKLDEKKCRSAYFAKCTLSRILEDIQNKDKQVYETYTDLLYSPEDITNLCFAMIPYASRRNYFFYSGVFLSELVNQHYEKTKSEEEYKIITEHFPMQIAYLAEHTNGANVCITGNVSNNLATEMKGGKVTLAGDAGRYAGERMSGGILEIEKCSDYVGRNMTGGKIITLQAEGYIGIGMEGGEIYIIEYLNRIAATKKGGKIFYKGEQVYPTI